MSFAQLWYDLKTKTHYLLDQCECDFCHGKYDIGLYARVWKKKKGIEAKSCMICVQKLKNKLDGEICEIFHVIRIESPGEHMIPVLALRPELQAFRGDVSVFDVNCLDSVRTVDRTKYSGFSLEGASVGASLCYDDGACLSLEVFEQKLLELKKK